MEVVRVEATLCVERARMLIGNVLFCRHEPLEVVPSAHQWTYFDMAEEAATDE